MFFCGIESIDVSVPVKIIIESLKSVFDENFGVLKIIWFRNIF